MKTLAILSAASAMVLAGSAAFAQPASPPSGAPGPKAAHHRLTRADFDALTDARIAGIQAGLKLNADQQKLWGPVEEALRAQAKSRADRMEQRRGGQPGTERPDLAQRLENQANRVTARAENLTALANAVKPFWASLDEGQKRLLPVLMHQGRSGHGWRHRGPHGRMGMGPHHRGPMQPPAPAPQQ